MSRRTGLRQHQPNADFENFPFKEGESVKCSNHSTGEVVTGTMVRLTKNREKLHVNVGTKSRWLKLTDFVIERDI